MEAPSEPPTRRDLESFRLSPPQEEAPAVVILDSGVALEHQLLKPAIPARPRFPGIDSPADAHDHGKKMAGAALYAGELAGALTRGEH